jgi:hypothetical protein
MHLRALAPLALGAATLISLPSLETPAEAQTVAPASGGAAPIRIVNGQPRGTGTRPPNLNPLGINYSDCQEDMALKFSVTLSGFAGENLQVWASKSSDCTNPADRGSGASGGVCWYLGQQLVAVNSSAPSSQEFTIRVQDIIGEQNAAAPVTTYTPQGSAACLAQATFSPVSININFVPLDASNQQSLGVAYEYVLNTDTVGPPPPGEVKETVGDALFSVTWNANTDSDTVGYDIFSDPVPGHEDGGTSLVVTEQTLVCGDSGAEDSATSITDASCHEVIRATTGQNGGANTVCSDPLLARSIPVAGSGTTTSTSDAGAEAGSAETGNGGISLVPPANLLNADVATGITVSDRTANQYSITGLTNGVAYMVAVAAVDAYGNVGPPSAGVCDYPAPTQDFWQSYRNDSGGAGGSFCALESPGAPVPSLASVAFVAAAAAYARRRKRFTGRPAARAL